MTPKRDGKPFVPGNGGYESEIVEVTGPPDRMMPMPPAKSRGRLTPMGTGEDLPDRPSPVSARRKEKSKPLVPTTDEMEALPRHAQEAFALRCKRRVAPAPHNRQLERAQAALGEEDRQLLSLMCLGNKPEEIAAQLGISLAAYSKRTSRLLALLRELMAVDNGSANTESELTPCAAPEPEANGVPVEPIDPWAELLVDTEVSKPEYLNTVRAMIRAGYTEKQIRTALAIRSAADAARIIVFEAATVDSPLTAQLRCIRRDFVRLKRLAREQKWTDDTPVPPDVFGPMWPEGIAPYWAVESGSEPPTSVS